MRPTDIAALLDEPACEHNDQPKTGCARPKPGASAGGCAFDGAQIALLPIADVAHIVHGPIGCAGASWDNRGTRSSGPALYRVGMTTDLTEQDVIMGRGEKRLLHAIKQAVETHQPPAVFVYNTCVPALVGDDLAAVCRAASEKYGVAVVPVDAAGFYGTKNLGNRLAGEVMVDHVIGTGEPMPLPPSSAARGFPTYDVNLIGEYNIAGELWHVLPLLDELGLRVVCALSGDARFAQVQSMHHARVNMMVCSKAMINVARRLEERYGTPWFEGSFYGVADVSEALRSFARIIGDGGLVERTEAVIAREEAKAAARLAPWRERLAGKRALLYTGGVKSWSVVSALQDLGMTVVATGTKKSTLEDKARIATLMGDDARMIDDGNPRSLLNLVAELDADVLVAGGRNMYTALKARIPFLHINQEREFAYAGYEGVVELARQLALTIDAPVWAEARALAPWERVRAAPPGPEPTATPVIKRNKALSVMPLKSSQTLGAALAFLGLHRSLPMLHGSQGCTAFAKVFFVQHFREPMPLQTSAMEQVSTVMGSEPSLVEGLATICRTAAPQIVGLPTTSLAEAQGSYVARAVRTFREMHPEHAETAIVAVAAPDFQGCLETGFAASVRAIIETLVPDTSGERGRADPRSTMQVNVLAGAALTPGDVEAVKAMVEAFGLVPLVLPDLADSLDGRLIDADFSPVTVGGTRVHKLRDMGKARANLVIGASLDQAGEVLAQRTGAPLYRLDHAMGLAATDDLVRVLSEIADAPVPKALNRQRARLLDAMLDCHFMLATSRFGVAGDPDLVKAFSDFLAESGAETVAAVASANAAVLARVQAPEVKIGDLEDLEAAARRGDAEMLVGNSHVVMSAERLGLPVLRAGFPQYDHYGGFQRTWVGYAGARQALFDIANALQHLERGEIRPYRSIYAPVGQADLDQERTPCPPVA